MTSTTEPTPKKSRKGLKIVLVSFVVLIGGCGAAIAGLSKAADEVSQDQAAQADTVTSAVLFRGCEVGDNEWGVADIKFTNPLDEEKGYIAIEVNFIDATDTVVGSGTVVFENLEPGQTAAGEATAYDLVTHQGTLTCTVADVTIL